MVPWEFRSCETTCGMAVQVSTVFQIEVIPGKEMWPGVSEERSCGGAVCQALAHPFPAGGGGGEGREGRERWNGR